MLASTVFACSSGQTTDGDPFSEGAQYDAPAAVDEIAQAGTDTPPADSAINAPAPAADGMPTLDANTPGVDATAPAPSSESGSLAAASEMLNAPSADPLPSSLEASTWKPKKHKKHSSSKSHSEGKKKASTHKKHEPVAAPSAPSMPQQAPAPQMMAGQVEPTAQPPIDMANNAPVPPQPTPPMPTPPIVQNAAPAPAPMMASDEGVEPFYKKKWFIAAAIIGLITIGWAVHSSRSQD